MRVLFLQRYVYTVARGTSYKCHGDSYRIKRPPRFIPPYVCLTYRSTFVEIEHIAVYVTVCRKQRHIEILSIITRTFARDETRCNFDVVLDGRKNTPFKFVPIFLIWYRHLHSLFQLVQRFTKGRRL